MTKYFLTNNNHILKRVSRWIKIRNNYSPNKQNKLYDYATDGYGYSPNHPKFNQETGIFLDYFKWNNKNWAINQFILLGGMMGGYPETFEDDDGKLTVVGAYDSENYYNPILIEFDTTNEYVRVYEEVHRTEEEIKEIRDKVKGNKSFYE